MLILVDDYDLDIFNLLPYSYFYIDFLSTLKLKTNLRIYAVEGRVENLTKIFPDVEFVRQVDFDKVLCLSDVRSFYGLHYNSGVLLIKDANTVFCKGDWYIDGVLISLTMYGVKVVLNPYTLQKLTSMFPVLAEDFFLPEFKIAENQIQKPQVICWSKIFFEKKYLPVLIETISYSFNLKPLQEIISFRGPNQMYTLCSGIFLHLSQYFDEHLLSTLCDQGWNIVTVSPIVKRLFPNSFLLTEGIDIPTAIRECSEVKHVFYPKFDQEYFNNFADFVLGQLKD